MKENYTYTKEQHYTWEKLYSNVLKKLHYYACKEFIIYLNQLNFPSKCIPNYKIISNKIYQTTGWKLTPVDGLVPPETFFLYLSNRTFPTIIDKIRPINQLDYYVSESPDLFHEFFGHCPFLMNQAYADFMHQYGTYACTLDTSFITYLERFFWFTVEFGLIQTHDGFRAYGAGILPSVAESKRSIYGKALRSNFDVVAMMTRNYSVTHMQPIYYVLDNYDSLYKMASLDKLLAYCEEAHYLENTKAIK